MKCVIPEISWNNRDPVLSVDIQPKIDDFVRLATSGTDTHIVVWYITNDENGAIQFEPVADLNKHQKAVNVVRWAPSGELLASGDDESNIIVWKRRTDIDPPSLDADSDDYKESYSIVKILRGHMDDVYDLAWSPDCSQLITGSVDNTAIIWNLKKTTKHILSNNHKGLVQGVTWDPLNKFYATMCSDRNCRVFDAYTHKTVARSSKGSLPFPESSPLYGQAVRLYHDDTLKSYFRRLTFSPDGNLLFVPSGCIETEHCNKKIYMTYIYTRYNFKQPTLAIPSPDSFTVVARCCPVLFTHRADGPKAMIPLPYRMVFAIASQASVSFYDTQQIQSFGAVTNIHYTRISDLSWSSDGLILAISSTDGFCSFVSFKSGELGEIYKPEEKEFIEEVKIPIPKKEGKKKMAKLETKELIVNVSDEACDAWVEKKPEKIEPMECDEICDTQDMVLILEESQTSDAKLLPPKKESQTENETGIKNTKSIEISANSVFLQTFCKHNSGELMVDDLCSNEVDSSQENKEVKIVETKINEEDVIKNVDDNVKNLPKTPRRVNFVTLSSPRGKQL